MTTMAEINPKIFKANDIRGKYPSEINKKVISEIVRCLVLYFESKFNPALYEKCGTKFKIVVAHDARLSSPSLYRAAIKGIMNYESGIKNKKISKKFIIHNSKFIILKAGLATTPMFYFLVKKLKASAGIMITASHNPKNYNGLKIVDKNALPISGQQILKILNSKF